MRFILVIIVMLVTVLTTTSCASRRAAAREAKAAKAAKTAPLVAAAKSTSPATTPATTTATTTATTAATTPAQPAVAAVNTYAVNAMPAPTKSTAVAAPAPAPAPVARAPVVAMSGGNVPAAGAQIAQMAKPAESAAETTMALSLEKIEKVPFQIGTSSVTVERLAQATGCAGGKGAGLVTEKGPVEVYRMQCDNGKVFLAKCELRQCSPFRW